MEIDLETVRQAVVMGLPLRARWLVGEVPLDYDFTLAHRGLRHLEKLDVAVDQWPGYWTFGAYDYAQKGGANPWLGVRKVDGVVCGLDLERDSGFFPLNSSIGHFIKTFDFLEDCLMSGDCFPAYAARRLEEIDPAAYPTSDWKALVEHLVEIEAKAYV